MAIRKPSTVVHSVSQQNVEQDVEALDEHHEDLASAAAG